MGLFDNLTSMIGNAFGGTGENKDVIAGQLMGVLQEHGINGVSGLVSQFEQSGLGEQAQSWISSGHNLPIDADSIHAALGTPVVASIAARLGVDPATAAQLLSEHLPNVVDHLTPDGQAPDAAPADGS